MSTQVLSEAGVKSQKDKIKGVSEKILVGHLTNIGTGCFKIINLDGGLNENEQNSDSGNNSDISSNNDGRKHNPISRKYVQKNPFSSSELREDKEENNSDNNSNSSPGISNTAFRKNIQGININDTSPQMDNQRVDIPIKLNVKVNENPKKDNDKSDDEEEEEDEE